MSVTGWRRRRFIVRGFQRRFVVTQLGWLGVMLVAFAAILLTPLASTLHHASGEERLLAAVQFLLFHQYLWPALAFLYLAAAAGLVKASHRIAGPLYRFRHVCGEVSAGRLYVSARVRTGDYLTLEAEAMEAMLVSLRARVASAQRSVAAADDLLRTCTTHHDLAPRVRDAAEAIADARQTLAGFIVAAAHEQEPSAERQDLAPMSASDERGFTLLEVLIVAAMISILAALGVPRYLRALDVARLTKAIADIKVFDKEIQVYGILNGCLPDSLADIGKDAHRDPWGRPYIYSVLSDKNSESGGPAGKGGKGGNGGGSRCQSCGGRCIPIGQARKDRALVPINTDFDLYSSGADGRSTAPLTAKASQDDIVRASDGGFVGLARDY